MGYVNKNLTYKEIFEFDIDLMNCVIKNYVDNEKAWEIFYEFYKDPDEYPLESCKYKTINGVKCTFDALLSVKRIKEHEGFNSNFVETFKTYRCKPIFFFPCEKGGLYVIWTMVIRQTAPVL